MHTTMRKFLHNRVCRVTTHYAIEGLTNKTCDECIQQLAMTSIESLFAGSL